MRYKCVDDRKFLQTDIDSERQRYGENLTNLNIQKTEVMSFTRKIKSVHFDYYVTVSIFSTDCIKDINVMLDSKLHFYCHVKYVHSHRQKILWRVCFYNLSSLNSFVSLYNILVRPKLEYALALWNNLTLTDYSKLESIIKYAYLCHSFFQFGI